jgi:hypothetical protein
MNWFKISANLGKANFREYVGCSTESLDALVKKATDGEYVRLDSLLYNDHGVVKEFEDWDASLIPSVFINPNTIVAIMQFKGDPRTTPKKKTN